MVRKIIRTFAVESFALYASSRLAEGMFFSEGAKSLVITGIGLTIAHFVVKPVITVLLLPINLVTFNLLRFASSAITLFLVDLALEEFSVTGFHFLGSSTDYLDLPEIVLSSAPLSYLAFSLILAVIANIIYWIIDRK